jgi:hypothetical protein
MGRKRKKGFKQMKMLASRVEESDYYKFEAIIKQSGKKTLQEVMNMFIVEMISGNLYLSGSSFGAEEL